MELKLCKEEDLLGIKCEFYTNEYNNVYMTRNQIGEALKYSMPRDNIFKLHSRHKERLDAQSVGVELTSTDQKKYQTVVYTEKSIYEICRFSRQRVADDFYNWTYEQMAIIRKTGGFIDNKDLFIDTYCGSMCDVDKDFIKDYMHNVERQ